MPGRTGPHGCSPLRRAARSRTKRCAAFITCSTRTRRPRRRKSSTPSPTRWRVKGRTCGVPARSCWGRMRTTPTDGWGTEGPVDELVHQRDPGHRREVAAAGTADPRTESRRSTVARGHHTGSARRRGCSRRCGARCSARPRSGRREPRCRGGTCWSRTPCRARPTGVRRSCAAPDSSRSCTWRPAQVNRGRTGRARVSTSTSAAAWRRTCRSSTVRSSRFGVTSKARCSSSRPP